MASQKELDRGSVTALRPKKKWSVDLVWTPTLSKTKFVPVVRGFLDNYSTLKPFAITHGEAMFCIHLLAHKWDEASPFPGYKRIARAMGISDKMARRYAASLEQKGYIVRQRRHADTNRFDLTKLFLALERAIAARDAAKQRRVA